MKDKIIEKQNEIFGLDTAWPLIEVLTELVKAADILLHERDYNRHGWEKMEYCFKRGEEIIKQLSELAALEQESKEQKIKDKCSKIYDKVKEAITPDKRTFEQAEKESKEEKRIVGVNYFLKI